MSDHPATFDAMLAAWNERDSEKIRAHLDQALAPGVHFVDPSIVTRGIDEFERNVREFRKRLPDAICSRASGVDSHHGLYRYAWEIHQNGKLLVAGFDVAEADDTGRIAKVMGFFGPLPPLP
jgi:hypothetical protein